MKIYVVATPIGNLDEVSKRTIKTFLSTDIFFCEDTRVIKKLLNLLNINFDKKEFVTINAFNEKTVVDNYCFDENKNYCLVSDAGYPIFSDPGFYLLSVLTNKQTKIEVVNGPCSIIHGLIVSGFPINNFYFAGFISNVKNEKRNSLLKLSKINSVLVIFEAVHKLIDTLEMIAEVFGNNVQLVVVKELSKLNETIYKGNIQEIIKSINLKGEFIIIINNIAIKTNCVEENIAIEEVKKLVKKGTQLKIACKMVAYKYNLSSSELYNSLQLTKNII